MWVTVQWRCSILQLFMPPKSFLLTRLTWSLSYLERRKCEIWQAIVPSFVLQIASHTPPHMSVPVSVYQQLLFLSPPIRTPPTQSPPPTCHYPHCSLILPSVVYCPWPPQWGGGGHRAMEQSHHHQHRLWRIMLFIAFVRRALQYFVSLLPTYCHVL